MATQTTAPTFLGLTETRFGVLAAWSDGRIAELWESHDAFGGLRLIPRAHADYAALWPEAAVVGGAASTSPGTADNATDWFCPHRYPGGSRCANLRNPGHAFCYTHEGLPARDD